MKLMIASDIHGSAYYCAAMLKAYEREKAEKLILLGDLLYHGPRNDLPYDYNPKKVIQMLNQTSASLLCVQGNCDAQVDQMVLQFPIMAEYMLLYVDGHTIFATHGHIHNENNLPPLQNNDILLHGHTHVQAAEKRDHYFYLNPGSVSIPKQENTHSYMIYENHEFSICELEAGNKICSISII